MLQHQRIAANQPGKRFGVDSLGRDIFSRVLVGTRISLIAGFFSVVIGALIGTFFGLLAGYYEGWWPPAFVIAG